MSSPRKIGTVSATVIDAGPNSLPGFYEQIAEMRHEKDGPIIGRIGISAAGFPTLLVFIKDRHGFYAIPLKELAEEAFVKALDDERPAATDRVEGQVDLAAPT